MMLKEYEIRYYVKPVNKLNSYLRLEGMDPLYIGAIEKEKEEQKRSEKFRRAAGCLFRKWIKGKEISRQPSLR